MAVVVTPVECSLRLTLQVGTGDGGEPIYRARTYNRVKPGASDQDIFDVAQALARLQVHPVATITRVNENNLSSGA
ncbi:Protein of unknown function [Thermanaeromonas toyohensis ToBE]|uniref:DUF1659 domain-containing protein n=1 Tax=Thermanaeromonas toyohensis ToBE TaxID=698762 RepID=A0A1W1W364_9FIRM|nr:DUF1659 domain-containing protein [Thermanaeromonas toyohensis]SMC00036.1 Protein of unknown function [Thermanaeromonas toyohensis ToBE]